MEVHPANNRERAFAVGICLLAFVVTATAVGTITDMMIQLQNLKKEKAMQESFLRSYLRNHSISAGLTVRVKLHVQSRVEEDKRLEAETKVLTKLPKNILMDLHNEARMPILVTHILFHGLRREHPRAVRQVCSDAVTSTTYQMHEPVFSCGDACSCMLFAEAGNLLYHFDDKAIQHSQGTAPPEGASTHTKLKKGEWICEIALWMGWENLGDLSATRRSVVLSLDATQLAEVLSEFDKAFSGAVMYGKHFLSNAESSDFVSDLGGAQDHLEAAGPWHSAGGSKE